MYSRRLRGVESPAQDQRAIGAVAHEAELSLAWLGWRLRCEADCWLLAGAVMGP
jgi:hypothetical protein